MRLGMLYWGVINIVTFLVFGWDKYKACVGKFRVSERMLFVLAAFGGAAGGMLAMRVFRHKIRKNKFTVGFPMIFIVQVLVFVLYNYGNISGNL